MRKRYADYIVMNKIDFNNESNHIDFEDQFDTHQKIKIIPNTKEDEEVKEIYDSHKKVILPKNEIIKDSYNLQYDVKPLNIQSNNDKRELDLLLLGFEDNEPLEYNKLDNAILFGNPSPGDLQLSNMQTEQGVSNPLNNKIRQAETGESLEDIKSYDSNVDNKVDLAVENILKQLDETYISDKESLKRKRFIKNSDKIESMKQMHSKLKEDKLEEEMKRIQQKIKLKANIKPIIEKQKSEATANKQLLINELLNNEKQKKEAKTNKKLLIKDILNNIPKDPKKLKTVLKKMKPVQVVGELAETQVKDDDIKRGQTVKGTPILNDEDKVILFKNNMQLLEQASSNNKNLIKEDLQSIRKAIKSISNNQIKAGNIKKVSELRILMDKAVEIGKKEKDTESNVQELLKATTPKKKGISKK